MKRLLLLTMALVLVFAVALADQRTTVEHPVNIRVGNIVDTIVADSGGLTWVIEADLTQPDDGFWINALLTVIDQSSNLADSTRTITGFDASQDSLSFSTFATDSIEPGDSLQLVIQVTDNLNYPFRQNYGWLLDSAIVDTSEVFRMTPGAAITSTHLIEVGDNQDSANTLITLEICTSPVMPNGQSGWTWVSGDTVTYATQDTVLYKAWGAKQAHWFRFILNPVEAPFSASHTATFVRAFMECSA